MPEKTALSCSGADRCGSVAIGATVPVATSTMRSTTAARNAPFESK